MVILAILYVCSLIFNVIFTYKVFRYYNIIYWKAFIPFYNLYLLCLLILSNGWLFILLLVPVVNVFMYIWLLKRSKKCIADVKYLLYSRLLNSLILLFGIVYFICIFIASMSYAIVKFFMILHSLLVEFTRVP